MGYGGEGKGKGKSSREWAEAGRALLQATIEPRQFTVNVALLSGQEILDKVELQGTENVSILIDKVQNALGTNVGVDLINTNGDKLHKDLPIEESGLSNGSTITALLTKTVPTVLKTKGNNCATAELKADGTVACTGLPHAGGDCHAIQDQLVDVQHIYATGTAFAALKADGGVVSWGAEPEKAEALASNIGNPK